jgi:hypothetical protein
MRIHERMAENRIKFSQRLSEMGDELAALVKEVEKNRKIVCPHLTHSLVRRRIERQPQTKELASRYERALQDAELATEKTKARLDLSSEELERVLLAKEGESLKESAVRSPGAVTGKRVIGKAVVKGGLLLKGKNPGNVSSCHRDKSRLRALFSCLVDPTAGRRHQGEGVERFRRV